MHELKIGLNADKFASFWMFPIGFLSLILFGKKMKALKLAKRK